MAEIVRRKSVAVNVGGVKIGGENPIVVQSMTNTDTADVTATVNQVMALARAGSEIVRVTVNTEAAAAAVPKIVDTLNLTVTWSESASWGFTTTRGSSPTSLLKSRLTAGAGSAGTPPGQSMLGATVVSPEHRGTAGVVRMPV